MKVIREVEGIQDAASNLGSVVKNSFTLSGWRAASANAAQAAAERAAQSNGILSTLGRGIGAVLMAPIKAVGWVVAAPFKLVGATGGKVLESSAKAGVWAIEQPVALAMKPVKWSLNLVAGTFERFPRAAPVVAAVTAVVGASNLVAKHHSRKMQQEHAALGAMLEAQAAAAQANAPVSYMNNPEASQAFVDARKAQDLANGTAPSSQPAPTAALAR